MKKEIIRREFFKLRLKQKSYSKCKVVLKKEFGYSVSIRTLKRWQKRFSEEEIWDLKDDSRKPKIIRYKLTDQAREKIIAMRKKTGWGCKKLKFLLPYLGLSEYTINKVLNEAGLTRKEHNRGQRVKYVRFQRQHANSLWHIDDSEFGKKGKIITVLDDCSRYCLGVLHTNTVSTKLVTNFLDQLIKKYGTPRQIITDNGSPYGGKSKHSKFDRWCRRNKIEHIRTRVKRPQTNGKVERLFGTIKDEIGICQELEKLRYRYNHHRPHESLKMRLPADVYDDFKQRLNW